jgi:hypothetical protein
MEYDHQQKASSDSWSTAIIFNVGELLFLVVQQSFQEFNKPWLCGDVANMGFAKNGNHAAPPHARTQKKELFIFILII